MSAVPGDIGPTVTWQPADNGGLPVTSYQVTLSPGGSTVTVPGGQTSAVVPGLDPSKLYTATVTATSPAGTSPASAPSAATAATTGLVPVALTLTPSAATVLSGHNAVLSGTLFRADGLGPIPGATLTVLARATGATTPVPVGTVTTTAAGTFSFGVAPRVSTRYFLAYAGGEGWAPASANVPINAQVNITATLSKATVNRKATVVLRGGVSVAAAGRTVVRQRWYANSWHDGPGARVGSTGHFVFSITPTTKGRTKFRVVLATRPGLAGSASPTVLLTVR